MYLNYMLIRIEKNILKNLYLVFIPHKKYFYCSCTCVLSYSAEEGANYLQISCQYSVTIWAHFIVFFQAVPPSTQSEAWSPWVLKGVPITRPLGLLLVRVICWVIWAERNSRIFSSIVVDIFSNICKIDSLLIAWINAPSDLARAHFNESLSMIKRNLAFAGKRILN